MNLESIITEQVKRNIEEAIALAESGTSAEVRVHIEDECKEDTMDRAAYVFRQLEMHKTELRNGVLIYVALGNRKMAILGDAGINQLMKQDDWDTIKEHILEHFKNNDIEGGLIHGLQDIGVLLHTHFPISESDRNELSNQVTTHKDI
ncbi:MAG TPA: TPM domain-containing protein [Flavobacteriales bacterium]|jgi:uncharacterized membrane protein